ncbi:MAG: nicotinamide-nucleotide amidohydrolase family protein, partial [Acutalibacter sp.]|nr:nicotinamide-nucleotide amidohydrolase family protein [Acutalibacter sp.]
TAESCTGGLLAKRITDISGSSAVFHMGCVTYANEVKEQLLGVPHKTLEEHGAVSQETARAMAEGIVRASGSSLGVGITGIAGPEGGTPEKPVGLVYIALSDGKNTWVAKRRPLGRTKERAWHRHCAASQALDMVRRYLQGLPVVEL